MGSYAIIGAHLTIANGAAWSAQYRGSGQVAVCFFGDGTTNIGAFHEALNYASVFKLPIVFVCENNLYMEYTSIADITAVARPAADRASAYQLESIVIDGNDADEVYLTASAALDRARAGDGPSLVEAMTYRHGGHSRADPGKYRPSAEVDAWKAHDPITVYRGKASPAGRGQGRSRRHRQRRRGRGRPRDRRGRSPAPSHSGERLHRRLGRWGFARGGTDVSRRRRARDRSGDAARRSGVPSARTSPAPAACSRRPSASSTSSDPSVSSTRRSPSRPSSGRRWARR